MSKEFWLVTTEHLKDRLWFKDEEDFKVGMNYVALLSATLPPKILAFILMSNHVHFVLECTETDALSFVDSFKKLYSQYFSHKYKSRELLRKNKVDFRKLFNYDESLEKAIAYVQMNSVAANICLHPTGYLWGTGNSFFNDTPVRATRVGDMSGRKLAALIHSRLALPSEYLMDDGGYILPVSYIPVKFVESVFKTPNRMGYFLRHSSKASHRNGLPTFDDQLVASALSNLITSIFSKSRLEDLNEGQKAELLKQVRYRFSADPNQISRVTGIPLEAVSKFLDMF